MVAALVARAHQTLKDTALRQELGIMAIAIRTAAGDMRVNPGPDQILEPGAILVAIGSQDQLDDLNAWAGG